jgi:hypothetical protein
MTLHRNIASGFLLCAASLLAGCDQGARQAPAPSAAPAPVPETTAEASPPDLSGVWMAVGVVNPDGDSTAPVYSEEGRERLDAFRAQFSELPEAGAACVGSGMPGVMLSLVSYPIEFVQNDSRILMVAELETQVRRVFIDGRAHPETAFPTNVGHSSGEWDGDTLVVDTKMFEPWPLAPWPRSEDARIVERFSMTTMDQMPVQRQGFLAGVVPALNDDVLMVDLTVTDPAYYDGPQHRIAYYQRMADDVTSEYACSRGLWEDDLENYRNN